MAESILRLKVSSEEYDNKLKQATNGLTRYIDGCRKVGGTLEVVEKDTLDYVRAIGQMDTTSRTATGKLAEMKKAFVELSAQYKQMTDAEKNSPMGKALAASLDDLKPRIIDTKKQLDEINDSLKGMSSNAGGGGLFGEGGLSGMLQVFGGNLMTKAAGYVASLGSEVVTVMNESAALAREAEGVQIAFSRLGDGSLLDGLRQATHGTVSDFELMKSAVKFNDFKLPVEELGTMLAFAQQKAKDTGQSVDYMVDSIVTGLGRKSLMILDNLGISASEVKEKMAETGDMTKAVGDIIREQMSNAGDYVETAADRATQANVELENAMLELGNAMRETFGYDGWDTMAAGIKKELVGAITFTIETINEAKMRFMELLQLMGLAEKAPKPQPTVPMPDGAYYEETDAQGNRLGAGRWLNGKKVQTEAADFVVTGNKHTKSGSGRSGVRSGNGFNIASIAFNPISDESFKFDPSQYAKESGLRPENILGPSDEWENYKDVITDSIGGISDAMNNLSFDNFQESYEQTNKGIEKLTDTATQNKMAMSLAGQAVNAFSSALSSMEDPGAKAAGMVMQALGSIALGFAQAAAAKDTVASGWAWLAWVAAGLGAMATAISTVHSLTGFAEGGIVGGNSFSGDNLYGGPDAMVNSGELVLNKAQQGNLASQLSGNGMQNIKVAGKIKGTDIILSIDRSLKLEGKQLLTWGR